MLADIESQGIRQLLCFGDVVGYVLEPAAAARHFAHQQQRVCFIGHFHRPAMFVEGEDRALDITSLEFIRPDRKQGINAGSVGQPRDQAPTSLLT